MRINIVRASGNNQAPAIINSMLGESKAAGRQLGEAFINEEGFDKKNYEVTMQHRTLPVIGTIMEVMTDKETFRAKLLSINIAVSKQENQPLMAVTNLILERPIVAD